MLVSAAFAATSVLVCATGLAAATPSDDPSGPPSPGQGPLAALYPPIVQGGIQAQFGTRGPHPVSVSEELTPCTGPASAIKARIAELAGARAADELDCSHAFPSGTDAPVKVVYFYPSDLPQLAPAPLVVWFPGITSDPGNYKMLASLWASRGFVVAIGYNFINSFPTDHVWATQAVIAEASRPDSPLYNRVDFGRTVLGGHSGGAGAADWGAVILPAIAADIDPRLRVIGAMSVEPGPQGDVIGPALTVPVLQITGTRDPFTMPNAFLMHYTTVQSPAYLATVVNGTHFSIKDGMPDNPAAALTTAFIEHLAGTDTAADQVFVGPNWTLAQDPSFTLVARNAPADSIS